MTSLFFFFFRASSNSASRSVVFCLCSFQPKLDIHYYNEPMRESIIHKQKAPFSTQYFEQFANGFVIATVCIISLCKKTL